jgi:hypothetical protein
MFVDKFTPETWVDEVVILKEVDVICVCYLRDASHLHHIPEYGRWLKRTDR